MTVPLTLDLVKKDNLGLRFMGLYKQSGPNAKAASDMSVYGLTGNIRDEGRELSSMFLFSPARSDGGNSAFSDRSAINLGGSAKSGKFQLNTSYLRVGEQFAGAKDFKLQPGQELADVTATFNPSANLSVSSSFKRVESLMDASMGEATATTAHTMTFTPGDTSKLTVSRVEVDKEKPGAGGQQTTTDKMQLEQQLSSNLSAVATHENMNIATGSGGNRLTTNQLSLAGKVSEDISFHSLLTDKDSSVSGRESGYGLSVDAGLFSALKLEASLSGQSLDQTGDRSDRVVKLSTTALRNMVVRVDWADRESEILGPEEVSRLHVEMSPASMVKLTAGIGQKDTGNAQELSKEARVEVSPFTNMKVGGGYKEVETNGLLTSRVTDVSASTKPVSFLELSGAYKSRTMLDQDDLDSLNLALSLDTGRLLKFTGAYMTNPEDCRGIIRRANSQSVGIKTDFGKLKLKGSLTTIDEYLAGRSSQASEFALDYRFSSDSLLMTSYSMAENMDASMIQTSIYTLGYTYQVASRMHIYLGGRMTTYEQNQMALRDKTEYEAEARVGIKF
jgi:hypothetical protein